MAAGEGPSYATDHTAEAIVVATDAKVGYLTLSVFLEAISEKILDVAHPEVAVLCCRFGELVAVPVIGVDDIATMSIFCSFVAPSSIRRS